MTAPFSFEESARRLGPAAEVADRIAEEAPPFSPEVREQLRALFASARTARPAPAAKAA